MARLVRVSHWKSRGTIDGLLDRLISYVKVGVAVSSLVSRDGDDWSVYRRQVMFACFGCGVPPPTEVYHHFDVEVELGKLSTRCPLKHVRYRWVLHCYDAGFGCSDIDSHSSEMSDSDEWVGGVQYRLVPTITLESCQWI